MWDTSIPLFKDERELIRKSISPNLKKYYYNVRVGVRLKGLHSKLKKEDALSTDELVISHPLHPDIDVLYWKKDYLGEPILNAVEVKYFRFDKTGLIRPPLYDGIGEALILCTYGVDYVHLWHFFDQEISNEMYNSYKKILDDIIERTYTINYKCEHLRRKIIYKKEKSDLEVALIQISLAIDILKEMEYQKSLRQNVLRNKEGAKTIRTLIKRAYRIVNK